MRFCFFVLVIFSLISCGGGGGREGTCFGSSMVCGASSSGANTAVSGTNAAASGASAVPTGISAEPSFLVEYIISGTTTEASLLIYEDDKDQTAMASDVRLPHTLSFSRNSKDFLYISATNKFAAGSIRVAIKINGVEKDFDEDFSAFGLAIASMTCCQ